MNEPEPAGSAAPPQAQCAPAAAPPSLVPAAAPLQSPDLPPAAPAPSRRRFAAVYVLPLLLLLAGLALPLIRGTETLYMRDVLNAHLAMKWSEARALRQGYFPLLDPYRGGGQPIAGNPNAVPFYPTNVLFLWAGPFWALNAHFWIHLLLAPFAFHWMARRWGLGREAAWAAAVCYTGSGFYLSHLSFYNMIAGATVAPALVAACLALAAPRPGERRALLLPAVAVLWGLMLLGGEPLLAALAGGLAAAAWLAAGGLRRPGEPRRFGGEAPPSPAGPAAGPPAQADAAAPAAPAGAQAAGREEQAAAGAPAAARPWWRWWRGWRRPAWGGLGWMAAAAACGTLIALPQIVEFLRILPLSFRGFKGYAVGVATIASWDPWQALEWLLPMLFGRIDVRLGGNFWGQRFFTGAPPFFPSLYPGLLALALVAAAGWPRGRLARAAWWAWGAIAAGLFCALGRFNPAMEWLLAHAGSGALRYPVKFWLPVAVGGALLCGIGFERLLEPAPSPASPAATPARRRFFAALGGLAVVVGVPWVILSAWPRTATRWLRLLIPADRSLAFVANERLRWAGLCLFSLVILGVLALLAWRLVRSPRAAWTWAGALLAVHGAAQVWLMQPLYPMDAVTPYRVPPPGLAYLPPGETVVNPDFEHLFGPSKLGTGRFASPDLWWLERRAFYELYPFTGAKWNRRYELAESPEGLDTYLTRMAQGGMRDAPDEQRLRLLAAWGVGRLVMDRALAPLPEQARLLGKLPSFGQEVFFYEVLQRAPEAFLARRVWYASSMTTAYRMLQSRAFDPLTDAVVPGSGPRSVAAGGTVRVVRRGPESLDLDLDVGPGGSVLVVQRAKLLYRATIDGRPLEVLTANLHRNGLVVPAGHHQVRMWVDRTNFNRSLAAAGLGLALLPLLALVGAGRRAAPAAEGGGDC
jgi:hypothetical protein